MARELVEAETGAEVASAGPASGPPRPRETSVTVVAPGDRWTPVDFAELWRYRELLLILAARDLKIRYRQTVVGVAWAVLQPVVPLVVFAVLFGLLGKYPTDGETPFVLTAFSGLLPWQFFAASLTAGAASLVTNRHVVTKVYFPRMLLPTASVLHAAVDFGIGLVLMAGLMAWYGVAPGSAALLLPGFAALIGLTALGGGLWLSALSALYRDFAYVTPFLIQIGFFVSPVIYETTALIPERWRVLYGLNPMVVAIEGFRWALLGERPPGPATLAVSTAAAGLLLASGAIYFRRAERILTDRI